MRPVGAEGLALVLRFPFDHRGADNDIAKERRSDPLKTRTGERQHISRPGALAPALIQLGTFLFIDDADGDLGLFAAPR